MRIGSLFSGIGGMELGLERSGLGEVLWQVELNSLRRRILAQHWPDTRRYADVRIVRGSTLGYVDLICGGFPCQSVSQAARGRNRGLDDEDGSGLWRHFARIVGEIRPAFVVVENVAAAKKRWLPTVRQDLHVLGYGTRAFAISATDVGAPHARERIFVVADTDRHSEPVGSLDAKVAGLPPNAGSMWNGWYTEPGTLRVDDGFPGGMDRLAALGDAVVPQCAEVVGRVVRDMVIEKQRRNACVHRASR